MSKPCTSIPHHAPLIHFADCPRGAVLLRTQRLQHGLQKRPLHQPLLDRSSIRTIALERATEMGALPSWSTLYLSALASSSNQTTSTWPVSHATCSGVSLKRRALLFTSALPSSSRQTISTLPHAQAHIRGVCQTVPKLGF